jgi:hypothetical protein
MSQRSHQRMLGRVVHYSTHFRMELLLPCFFTVRCITCRLENNDGIVGDNCAVVTLNQHSSREST